MRIQKDKVNEFMLLHSFNKKQIKIVNDLKNKLDEFDKKLQEKKINDAKIAEQERSKNIIHIEGRGYYEIVSSDTETIGYFGIRSTKETLTLVKIS